jgi:hypothetical protein
MAFLECLTTGHNPVDLTLLVAVGATAYAVLSEWLGENPKLKANSVIGLFMQLLHWCYERYRRDPAAQARRTMTSVDDQARTLHAQWNQEEFQEQLDEASIRRAELLRRPEVQDVRVQLFGNRVILAVDYTPTPEQTGESLKLGGPMEIQGSTSS